MATSVAYAAFTVLGDMPAMCAVVGCFHAGVALYNGALKQVPLRTVLW
jgi:hypothetical protein